MRARHSLRVLLRVRKHLVGTEEAFGSDGTYAKSDTPLDFTSPTNRYTYTFSVEDANITPIAIDESAFNA